MQIYWTSLNYYSFGIIYFKEMNNQGMKESLLKFHAYLIDLGV